MIRMKHIIYSFHDSSEVMYKRELVNLVGKEWCKN
jgi:hypothetical protein